jgi:hypothetical protein
MTIRLPSSSMEEGWGWWCSPKGEAEVSFGAGALRRHWLQVSGHTTTQPSSIEEEGDGNQVRAPWGVAST